MMNFNLLTNINQFILFQIWNLRNRNKDRLKKMWEFLFAKAKIHNWIQRPDYKEKIKSKNTRDWIIPPSKILLLICIIVLFKIKQSLAGTTMKYFKIEL